VGVEPTDLAALPEGTSRVDAELSLGQPLEEIPLNDGRAVEYEYDMGYSGIFDQANSVSVSDGGLFVGILMMPLAFVGSDRIVSEQKGRLSVVYDGNGNVRTIYPNLSVATLKSGHEGNSEAQYALGNASVDKSVQQAYWYCRAAHSGNQYAQFRFGAYPETWLYPYPIEIVDRYVWLVLATQNGHAFTSDHMTKLAELMTSNEIADAKRLAAQWRPNPDSCELDVPLK
jgi:TPR repeat protein